MAHMRQNGQSRRGLRQQFRALKREIDQTVQKVVADGMDDGSIARGDVRLTTFTVTGVLNWIARWYDPDGPVSREDIAGNVVSTLLNGLPPRPSTGS